MSKYIFLKVYVSGYFNGNQQFEALHMKNLTLRYEKEFVLKKIFDDIIDTRLSVHENLEKLRKDAVRFKDITRQLFELAEIEVHTERFDLNSVDLINQLEYFLSLFFYASHFTNSGKISIELDGYLSRQLTNTKLDNIKFSDIVFPFNSFYFRPGNINLQFEDFDLGIHGIYVAKSDTLFEMTAISDIKSLGFLRMDFPISDTDAMLTELVSKHSIIHCNTHEELKRYAGHPDEDEMLKKATGINFDLTSISHLVFSSLLYLNTFWAQKERVEEKFEYKKLTKNIKKNNNNRNPKKLAVKLANAENLIYLKLKESETTSIKSQNQGRVLRNLTLVRGHWRKQPVGPREEKKHKIIWIQPFWKGEGTIQGKTYKA